MPFFAPYSEDTTMPNMLSFVLWQEVVAAYIEYTCNS